MDRNPSYFFFIRIAFRPIVKGASNRPNIARMTFDQVSYVSNDSDRVIVESPVPQMFHVNGCSWQNLNTISYIKKGLA